MLFKLISAILSSAT